MSEMIDYATLGREESNAKLRPLYDKTRELAKRGELTKDAFFRIVEEAEPLLKDDPDGISTFYLYVDRAWVKEFRTRQRKALASA
jgi:hypothetical protein